MLQIIVLTIAMYKTHIIDHGMKNGIPNVVS